MKDFTSTAFGLVIAYLLPGVFGMITLSFWSETVRQQFDAFTKAPSNVGLFFVAALVALLVGLELTAIRWVVFEQLFCRRIRLRPDEFGEIRDEKKSAAFRIAIDEHYRYHQFWGGMTPVIPLFFLGLTSYHQITLFSREGVWLWSLCAGLEAITISAAINSYIRYVKRSREIFKER